MNRFIRRAVYTITSPPVTTVAIIFTAILGVIYLV